MRTVQLHSGWLDERIRHDEEVLLPALRKLKGFKSLFLVADH